MVWFLEDQAFFMSRAWCVSRFLLQHSADAALSFAQHHCVVEVLQGTKWDAWLVFFDFPAV